MEKIDITIIHDPEYESVHIAVDNGIFQSMKTNEIIIQLLKIIHKPDKYNITMSEV